MTLKVQSRLKRTHFPIWLLLAIALGIGLTVSCSNRSKEAPVIQIGQTDEDVLNNLGPPDERQQFHIPDEPFFGPQENLVEIVPAGTLIEEWRYSSSGEVLYVWFRQEDEQAPDAWLVISHATFPADAVY